MERRRDGPWLTAIGRGRRSVIQNHWDWLSLWDWPIDWGSEMDYRYPTGPDYGLLCVSPWWSVSMSVS